MRWANARHYRRRFPSGRANSKKSCVGHVAEESDSQGGFPELVNSTKTCSHLKQQGMYTSTGLMEVQRSTSTRID